MTGAVYLFIHYFIKLWAFAINITISAIWNKIPWQFPDILTKIKFPDFSLTLLIFPVFPVFQTWWEPCKYDVITFTAQGIFCTYWGENSHKLIVNLSLDVLIICNKSWKSGSFCFIINVRMKHLTSILTDFMTSQKITYFLLKKMLKLYTLQNLYLAI